FDFYPPQTIQPFAIVDSLLRLGLAAETGLQVTAFDLNPRVNEHLEAAARRAREGEGYVVHLPLAGIGRWAPALVEYWKEAGRRVGEEVPPLPVPDTIADLALRAVRVRPG